MKIQCRIHSLQSEHALYSHIDGTEVPLSTSSSDCTAHMLKADSKSAHQLINPAIKSNVH